MTFENGVRDSDISVLTFVPVPNGTELDSKVLEFCYKQARKVADIARYLGVSNSTYLRKDVLDNLVQNGYLIKSIIILFLFSNRVSGNGIKYTELI